MKRLVQAPTGSKLLASVVLFSLGLLLLIAPMETLITYVRVIGGIFLAAAAVGVVLYVLKKAQTLALIGAIIGAITGLVFLISPGVVTGALPFVFGALLLIASVSDLFSALALPFGKLISIILSLVGIIHGLVILMNPNAIAAFVTRLIGLSFIYEAIVGAVAVVFARRAGYHN